MRLQWFIKKCTSLLHGGFFYILSGNILNKAIALISGIVIARFIDKVEYANISYADNIYSYITMISGLGLSSAILKYCSTQNDKTLEKSYMQFAFRYGGISDLLISLIACVIITFVDIPYPRARIYMWSFLLFPLLSHLNTCIICYMRTQLENRRYAMTGIINSVASCIVTIGLVVLIGTIGIVPARYLGIIATLTYSYFFYRSAMKDVKTKNLSKGDIRAFVSMGLSLMVANLFSGIMPLNENFLVNNIIGDEITTSNFRVAGQFPQLLYLFSGAVTVYYFPIIAKMKDNNQIRKKIIEIGIINFAFIAGIAIVGVILTPFAFRLLYAGKYDDAIKISYTLWLMRATNSCFRMVPMNMLPAIGKTKFNAYMSIGSCFVQVAIDYVLISNHGVMGVAYGAIIVYVLSGVLYWSYFLRCVKNR